MAIPHSDQLLPLTFIVIIGTVVLQSATARRVAVALGLAQPEPTGFLIVGANPVARAVGRALNERDITVRLCDSDWESLTKARMENLPTYYGNPTSEHARRNLDLTGIGRVLALGAWNHFNELVTARFREQFGKSNIYALPEAPGSDAADKHRAAVRLRGRPLFRSGADYWTLSRMLAQGGAVRATTMTGSYDYPRYIQGYQGQLIPLFAIDDKGIAHPFTSDADLEPEEGWTVLSLFPPEVEARRMNVKQERNAANGADGPARGG